LYSIKALQKVEYLLYSIKAPVRLYEGSSKALVRRGIDLKMWYVQTASGTVMYLIITIVHTWISISI
jgi:hypothetical protein